MSNRTAATALIAAFVGDRADALLETLDLDRAVAAGSDELNVSRIGFAAALNAVLFDRLLERVPTGAAFVADQRARGHRIAFDHGALRTIRFGTGPTGELPAGQEALTRILEPLGYRLGGVYPLPLLKMTGRAWVHDELPEQLPQFFVSELHVEQFDAPFAAVAHRVFGASTDPLDSAARLTLDRYRRGETVSLDDAVAALPTIVAAFGRQHPIPDEADYAFLLGHSAEAAWIATEGNVFNHATSRVDDVAAEADRQRSLGLPVKDQVEISKTGRVRQTAFRADPVIRMFKDADRAVERQVPGSFYEIISRDVDPSTGRLDLSFDSGNAAGIFQMTKAA
nr:DUF1338 family protein [Sphingosinicella sp. CPCC 101087]